MKNKNNQEMFNFLFGIDCEQLKETCVITPFCSREIVTGLQISNLKKGFLYSSGNNDIFSVIITKMGAGFTGDAVLYLKDTNCKNLIFFGSCGAIRNDIRTGSIIIVKQSISQDSFVNILLRRKSYDIFYPGKDLFERITLNDKYSKLIKATCITVGSLKMEKQYIETQKSQQIDVVDMETSAFLAASKYIDKNAVSIMFVTDNIKNYPFYKAFKDVNKIKEISFNASNKLFEICNKL